MEMDYTRKFSIQNDKDPEIKKILSSVYQSLQEKGYNPINQIVGYILSEDPTYITNYNNARALTRMVAGAAVVLVVVMLYVRVLFFTIQRAVSVTAHVFSFLLHLQHTTARPFVRIGPETDEGGVFP